MRLSKLALTGIVTAVFGFATLPVVLAQTPPPAEKKGTRKRKTAPVTA